MSRYNLRFKQNSSSSQQIQYDVMTSDFNDAGQSELIGKLTIDMIKGNFNFMPSGIWSNINVVPLDIFMLPENVAKQKLSEGNDYKYVDWAFKIFKRAQLLLDEAKAGLG